MKVNQPIVAAACLALTSYCASVQEPPTSTVQTADNYKLVWADEFNQDGPPDPANWSFERGFVRNEELQWYQPENARCEGGLLMIEGRRERVKNPRYDPEARDWRRRREFAEYTSACLHTRRKHEWLYGRFEMRGRIDTRAGMWPAWWMLGTARGWPGGGEIDIMEYYRGQLLANVAWLGRRRGEARWDDSKRPITEFRRCRLVEQVSRLADGLGPQNDQAVRRRSIAQHDRSWRRRSTAIAKRPIRSMSRSTCS